MPAVPAWPQDSGVRLFVDRQLAEGDAVWIDGAQAHYLLGVMRLKAGARLKLFDDVSGEWLGEIVRAGKRDLDVALLERIRERESVPDLWLGAAPIRRARYDWVVEKACELGVARFTPVMMRRAVVDRVKHDKLRAHMIEAAEQCGRTALPILDSEMSLKEWLTAIGNRPLYFADEAGGAPMRDAMTPGSAAILIGPEGGFDDGERDLILAHPSTVRISLGPRILRADTAAVAAVAAWLALTQ
ncbi:Ribosomal RNA small subunit methyltransferase E [Sphingomonas antarctica]|uniref:16S rRNA (uracil(1498)-N(3))-methyltransferase n=1 Tax=Sphingomonas antarctica TaxID=2040274 RepID=UPI0039EA9714